MEIRTTSASGMGIQWKVAITSALDVADIATFGAAHHLMMLRKHMQCGAPQQVATCRNA